MNCSPEALGTNIDVHDDALGFVGKASIAIGHREGNHLVRTGDDTGKLRLLFILTFDDGFDYGRVVAAEIDEDVGYAGLERKRG